MSIYIAWYPERSAIARHIEQALAEFARMWNLTTLPLSAMGGYAGPFILKQEVPPPSRDPWDVEIRVFYGGVLIAHLCESVPQQFEPSEAVSVRGHTRLERESASDLCLACRNGGCCRGR